MVTPVRLWNDPLPSSSPSRPFSSRSMASPQVPGILVPATSSPAPSSPFPPATPLRRLPLAESLTPLSKVPDSLVFLSAYQRREKERIHEAFLLTLHEMSEKVNGCCSWCLGQGQLAFHPLTICSSAPRAWRAMSFQPFRSLVKFQPGLLCFTCWLPKPKDDRTMWHGPPPRQICLHGEWLAEACVSVWESQDRPELMRRMGLSGDIELSEWGRWLAVNLGKNDLQRPWSVAEWLLKRVLGAAA